MTEPGPLAGPSLDQQILDAGRALNDALRARPRDQARIDAARAELNRLTALRDAGV